MSVIFEASALKDMAAAMGARKAIERTAASAVGRNG